MIPKPCDSVRIVNNERLSVKELDKFLKDNGISGKEFSEIMGVSEQAVLLWRSGSRKFSTTNTRLIRMFTKWPSLIKEF